MRIRSILFTPASRLDRLSKARDSGADWVVVDLEDGVAVGEKSQARQDVVRLLRDAQSEEFDRTALRINAVSTSDGIRDLNALLEAKIWPGMLVLPKVESIKELVQIRSIAAEAGHNPAILLTLETAIGIENASQILRGCANRVAVGYGSADHTAETGSTMSASALAWARGRIVNACATAGVPAIDGVCLEFRDMDQLRSEAEMVKDMGFAGKIAIHPAQVAPINSVFTPSRDEVTHARAMIAASDTAGGGAFSFKGKMVDAPVLAQAHRTLASFKKET